jgi:hypothetical protein
MVNSSGKDLRRRMAARLRMLGVWLAFHDLSGQKAQ